MSHNVSLVNKPSRWLSKVCRKARFRRILLLLPLDVYETLELGRPKVARVFLKRKGYKCEQKLGDSSPGAEGPHVEILE